MKFLIENELEKRHRKHKKTIKPGAMGSFIHPDKGNQQAIDTFNNSVDMGAVSNPGLGEALNESYQSKFKDIINYIKSILPENTHFSYDDYRVIPDDMGSGMRFQVEFDSKDSSLQDKVINSIERKFYGVTADKGWGRDWDYYVTIKVDDRACNESLNEDYAEDHLKRLISVQHFISPKDDIQLFITEKGNYLVKRNGKKMMILDKKSFRESEIEDLRLNGYFDAYDKMRINEGISKLDIIKSNKQRYADLEKEIASMPDGLEKDVAKELGLRWIKGRNWEGGLGNGRDVDRIYQKLMDKYNVSFEDIDNIFTGRFIDPENWIYESLNEDTIKQNGKWVNKGKEGTHGKFNTKKAADAQRKAMFANGYKESLREELWDSSRVIDITRYCFDKGYDLDKTYRVIINQMKKEGSSFPKNLEKVKFLMYDIWDELSYEDDPEYFEEGMRYFLKKGKTLKEAFDADTVKKRIARYNEFDNGHVLFDYNKWTSDEAEEKARQVSIKNPHDVYYVKYDNIMNPCSDIVWYRGKSYNSDEEVMDVVNKLKESKSSNQQKFKKPNRNRVDKEILNAVKSIGGDKYETITNQMSTFEFPSEVTKDSVTKGIDSHLKEFGYSTDIAKNGRIYVNDIKDEWHSVEITITKDTDNYQKGKVFYTIEVVEVF